MDNSKLKISYFLVIKIIRFKNKFPLVLRIMVNKTMMVDDTKGRVKEAMIFIEPDTSVAIQELISSLPDSIIYAPYGPPFEDLEQLIRSSVETMDGDLKRTVDKFFDIAHSYMKFIDLFTMGEKGAKSQVRQWRIDSKRKRASLPFKYEDAYEIYSKSLENPEVMKLIYLCLGLYVTGRAGARGTYEFITALKQHFGERLNAFPAGQVIGGFARDMIIPARYDAGFFRKKGVLIQGKPQVQEAFGWSRAVDSGSVQVAENPFWNGKYETLPPSQVNLASYVGGDLRAASETLFVGQDTWLINLKAGYTPEQIEEELRRISGRERIVVVGRDISIPFAFHLDMYFTPFDDKTIAVGDTAPVVQYLESRKLLHPIHTQSHRQKKPYLDEVARRFEEQGFEVARIPFYLAILPGGLEERMTPAAMRSFANDIRDGNTAIVATFGVPELDEPSQRVFNRYGLTVREITTAGSLNTFLKGDRGYDTFTTGGVRCLVNVLSKG